MKLYNSLTRKIEDFKPINQPGVGIYVCGPTVYDYVTIGNWRTYALGDLLARTLEYSGYKVDYIMNITDVGHLTGDNLGDADIGEDRIEQAAKLEGKTAWDIAKFYTGDFLAGYKKLNLFQPKKFTKATDHIKEQIDLIKKIEARGFAYKTSDGIYFDVKNYEKAGNKYGELSTLDKIKEGARIEMNPEKKDQRDFALWKFSPSAGKEKRQMEWDALWGKGFPGWHIECSAMSMKCLGEQFDVHLGGEDLKSVHHPNETAQSEAATGKKPFVKYWLHGAFLLVDGGRMGKSLGNAYTLRDVEKKGFDPMALKYFYLTGHYRKQLNFTWGALEAANNAYQKLKNHIAEFKAASTPDFETRSPTS
ncbi:MAG: cysteine--tRNA ligase, partial [Patescibacteria group bacterium]